MTAGELIERVELAGGCLTLRGERVHYRIPRDTERLLAELRARKAEVVELLRRREAEQDAARFGVPHARLYPFLGYKVRTPEGPGTLLQVFSGRVTVLLDANLDKACRFFAPEEIEPVGWEL